MPAMARMFTALFLVTFAISWRETAAIANPKPESYWNVDEVRAGMKGQGKTCIKGTKIDPFDAEVIGVLRNTSPGRDMILCRLSGANLEKTGVIAGMSGSPIYINGKLLGAVAFAWPFGKEPIAGVTPFSQMHEFVESYEKRDLADKSQPRRIGLAAPVRIGDRHYDVVTVSPSYDDPTPATADGLWMVPLRTPVGVSGFTPNSLAGLREQFRDFGLVPMQAGAVSANVADAERNTPLVPGGALMVAMVTGDFDMSSIGTVTHIEGKRVYGFGHPFFGMGACDMPAMTGYVHLINPRLTMSFKMGSPLRTVGTINADVSTCVAGWLDRKPDMLPMRIAFRTDGDRPAKVFNVEIMRQRLMLPGLVQSVLTNAVDIEGDLPDEVTAHVKLRVELEDRPPLVLDDLVSGPQLAGPRGPVALYAPVVPLMQLLVNNNFASVRVKRIDSQTELLPGRRSAEIEGIEVESETYAPGDTLKATVLLRPYKSIRQRLPVELKLPVDLPEGNYTATVGDDLASARQELRDNPNLNFPQDIEHLFKAIDIQLAAKRTNLTVRVPTQAVGVALGSKSLPNLPPSMVHILGNGRRTGAQTISGALIARQETPWVILGSETIRFQVAKNKRVTEIP
jgi:SpoIVB peptidase S55